MIASPRYVAYARVHGREPLDMLLHDFEAWPAGQAVEGFKLWTQARWLDWRFLNRRPLSQPLELADHVAFDAWLLTLPVESIP